MENKPKISVLTAVYNAEKFLRVCLDSLMNQTLTDCQFICIDDCSTDGSAEILQEYAKRDARFQVLHTPVNSGIAKTRNLGIKFVCGEYVATLDADDWFAPDALEQAYHALKSADAQCAVFQLVMCDGEGENERLHPIKSDKEQWTGEEAFRLSIDWSLHGLYVTTADMYRHFPFDDASFLYSDENTTHLHYFHSGRVVRCSGCYFYRQHGGSVTHACSVRRFDRMIANWSLKRHFEQLEFQGKQELLNFYELHRWLNIVGCYWYYYQHFAAFTPKEQAEIEALFKKMLQTVEAERIPWREKMKLGYYPFKSYKAFSRAERLYFSLREMVYRLCGKSIAAT